MKHTLKKVLLETFFVRSRKNMNEEYILKWNPPSLSSEAMPFIVVYVYLIITLFPQNQIDASPRSDYFSHFVTDKTETWNIFVHYSKSNCFTYLKQKNKNYTIYIICISLIDLSPSVGHMNVHVFIRLWCHSRDRLAI